VITEGMSDVLLLPTLIREATGKARLSYQAAPSFSEADGGQIRDFDLIAARSAFLADGDGGGKRHVEKLLENGMMEEQIRYLGGADDSGLTIEDLLVREVYLKAVNVELQTWHQIEFPESQLPDTERSSAVEAWCKQKGEALGRKVKISKVDIAQNVLDQRSNETQLLDDKFRELVADLDAEFEAIFQDAPGRVKRLNEALAEAEAKLADG
jgi:hypothetical protein